MIENPELGYTPNNLKAIRAKHGLTYQQVADATGTASWRTAAKWERNEADMPYKKWQMLLHFLTK